MEIETERLVIRSLTLEDLADYAMLVADPEVMRYLGEVQGGEAARRYVMDCVERDQSTGISRYAVTDREGGEFMGFCGFKEIILDSGPDWLDFGWRYQKRFWRQGIGIEAARAVHRFGTDELNLSGIEARAHVDNTGSLRIIELLGFEWTEDYETPVGAFRRFVEP
jgi:RimJ/RimL family protein N-acetyltransferase